MALVAPHGQDAVVQEVPPRRSNARSDPCFRVLVVEHHQLLGTALRRYLSWLGHEVELATGLRAAQALLQTQTFDVLLADVRLPDGLCFFLFQDGEHALPPYVATMSAYELEADVLAAYPCVRRHLLKTFTAEELDHLFASFADEAGVAFSGGLT